MQLIAQIDRFAAVARLADDFQIGLFLENPPKTLSQNVMIVSQ
jgi:hypothetical protein